jgi:hypothetical protein
MPKIALKYIFAIIFLINCLEGFSQKTFYSKKTLGWEDQKPDNSQIKTYTIFLIGDIKNPNSTNKVLDLLEMQMNAAGQNSAVVVLGDILYQQGMPDSTANTRKEAEKNLEYILSKFDNYKGEIIFIPGNHDWAQGRKHGWNNLKNLEFEIEKRLNRGNVFVPDGGCPGPVEIPLNDKVTLIAFDYQWWMHRYDKPHPIYNCNWSKDADFFTMLEDAIQRNANKQIVLATHFPLYSVGNHGGYFPLEQSLFPLTERKDWMYIPLPGFIYTGFRKIFGNIQDLPHPEYKALKEMIWSIIKKYPNIVYTAGHEHNLQYLNKDSIHHIISGGGGEGTYISRRKRKADFAAASEGYSVLEYFNNGDVWMKFVKPDEAKSTLLYQKKLYNKLVKTSVETEVDLNKINYSDSIVKKALNDIYKADPSHEFWMGKNYRTEWNTEVSYPVFDIGKEKGGLKIIQKGGGQQTTSVRLEDKSGKQFVLRSVNKNVKKAIDKFMQNTIFEDIVQDGISASHPFASLTIPKLADALGIYHTNPKMVWLPDDPRFGMYRKDIANNVFLFEERPQGNAKKIESFGESKKIISTARLIKAVQNDHDKWVDQKAVLKARLFDILINDWDRHDDQWRWASFKKKSKTIYQPIPRDRDQVYFVNEGPIMWLIRQDFLMPKFQGLDYEIKNVKGLGFNARYFDRAFLTELNRDSWIKEATNIKSALNDSIIHEAINELPPEIYAISGETIQAKLKSRLNNFQEYAEEYYDDLSKSVDVVGTNERDYFRVNREANGDMDVSVYELSDKKAKIKDLFYHRKFKYDETKEVRLYGLAEKDLFEISGKANKGIKLRMIGGKEKDSFTDHSKIRGWSRKNIIYDRSDKTNIYKLGNESRLKLAIQKSVNKYDRMQFKFNKNIPLLSLGYNIDDGIILGAGLNLKRYNFRDSTSHQIMARYAYLTSAFSVKYSGMVSSVFNKSNLLLDAEVSLPRSVDNFFGLGNITEKLSDDKSYYKVRHKLIFANPKIVRSLRNKSKWSIGAFYKYIEIRDTADRFIGSANPAITINEDFKTKNYFGINASIDIDGRNDKINPVRGLRWYTEAEYFSNLNGKKNDFLKLKSDLSFYISFKKDPRYVFALKFGGAKNIGDYDFLHANYLGNKSNLRGFLSHRFGGESYLYQNTELRIKLLNIRRHFFVGQWGILFFNDVGKVWIEDEKSSTWHNGYGFGTWISPFNATIINLTYQMSKEEKLFTMNVSFYF